MKAMILDGVSNLDREPDPLKLSDLPMPEPQAGELLIQVSVCGVCHTELDEIEGRTPPPEFPMVLGHQIVGRVAITGQGVSRFNTGDRVGIAWIHSACGSCWHCRNDAENLCEQFKATGRDVPGGYAEYTTVSEDFAYRIPEAKSSETVVYSA